LEATGSAFELPATGIFPVEIGRAAADFFALLGFRSALLSSVCPPHLTPAPSVVHHLVVGVIFAGKGKAGERLLDQG
jgi:hypothetical protein